MLGVDTAGFEPEQGAELTVGELDIAIQSAAGGNGMLFTVSLGSIPGGAGEAFYRRLLDANRMLDETSGSALAINTEYEEVLLCRSILQNDLSFEAFDNEFNVFLKTAYDLMTALNSGRLSPSEDENKHGSSIDDDAVHIRL